MKKMKRNERIGAIVKVLSDKPNAIFTLSYFTELFNSAKSTISEDIAIVKSIMEELNLGKVETISGAAGGVKFIPVLNKEKKEKLLNNLVSELSDLNRIVPGGFLYIADILCNPRYIKEVGEVFAEKYSHSGVDYVMTVETKGIPLATLTAERLNVPLVIARNENKISEGSKLSINYVSGSTGKVQTMYVAKKAIPNGSNVLIVDDFMRAGGTIKGMEEIVKELNSKVVGACVLMETKTPEIKMYKNYMSILFLEGIINGKIIIHPNEDILK
ncbi:pur operon repressor [Helicovermis profundi]|uniref:Pur operon repressor n=1 Tax=Helicovermis profundi TaxID=3065157 RepID=A0AAU9EFJ6_9FIRM|nr:pur operon repressor [Clostridia bacterium S502]